MTPYPPIDPLFGMLRPFIPEGRVLDLSSGDGRHALEFARLGLAVDAIDTDSESLVHLHEVAEKSGLNVSTVQADLRTFIPHNSYSLIFSFATLHHLTEAESEDLIKRMKHATIPGGVHAIHTVMPHVEDLNREGFAQLLPFRDWYRDWTILDYREEAEPGETKVPESDKWLLNTVIRIIAQKA